ncbi:unnamed protein product [Macrosiphum euphorbiae]|uniref:Uncharacterized protein n=1 Tax=Macrosiphum euphorbiae TaxID=13131 RepID=A0AAV0X008_9HEMI|nr:unnamed protein product [Macrosiphum euphorbiae]
MSSDNTSNQFEVLDYVCKTSRAKDCSGAMDPMLAGKPVKRRAYIMQPSQIFLSRPAVDLDHIFSSRAQFYGAMAAKRLKAVYYGNIASAKTESHVPNDLVDQIPGSTFQQLVANCVKDLARTACVPELHFACAQNLPAQVSTVEIVDPVTFIENDQDVASGQTTESGIQVHEQVPPAASVEIEVKRRRTLWSPAKKLFSRMI